MYKRQGTFSGASGAFDGYLADIYSIDGQALAPTDFGEFDDNNVWQPKAFDGTYGTNGFHLDFSDNSSNAALGTDSSGNSNDWTVNNLTAESPGTSLPGVHFDGTGDLLSIPNNVDFNFGSGNFTIEGFFQLKAHSTGATSNLFGINNGAGSVPKLSSYVCLLYTSPSPRD